MSDFHTTRKLRRQLQSCYCFFEDYEKISAVQEQELLLLNNNSVNQIKGKLCYLVRLSSDDKVLIGKETNYFFFKKIDVSQEGRQETIYAYDEKGNVYQVNANNNQIKEENLKNLSQNIKEFLDLQAQQASMLAPTKKVRRYANVIEQGLPIDDDNFRISQDPEISKKLRMAEQQASKFGATLLPTELTRQPAHTDTLQRAARYARQKRKTSLMRWGRYGLAVSSIAAALEITDLAITGSLIAGPFGLIGYGLLLVGTWFWVKKSRFGLLKQGDSKDPKFWSTWGSTISHGFTMLRLMQKSVANHAGVFLAGLLGGAGLYVFGGGALLMGAVVLGWLASSIRKMAVEWDTGDKLSLSLETFSAGLHSAGCAIGLAVLFGAGIALAPYLMPAFVVAGVVASAFKAWRKYHFLKKSSYQQKLDKLTSEPTQAEKTKLDQTNTLTQSVKPDLQNKVKSETDNPYSEPSRHELKFTNPLHPDYDEEDHVHPENEGVHYTVGEMILIQEDSEENDEDDDQSESDQEKNDYHP